MWTLQRLADPMAEQTGIRVSYQTIRRLLLTAEIVAAASGFFERCNQYPQQLLSVIGSHPAKVV
jgi:hypothetical protein